MFECFLLSHDKEARTVTELVSEEGTAGKLYEY